jgi:8-oxo-dGTP pyrophosphatase MutT (NUDIX family)
VSAPAGEGASATPRPSGTAVLIRAAAEPLEVLLLKRADATAVGDWVFPGGKVEPNDVVGGDPGSLASAVRAAVRETREEAGVDLAATTLAPISRWITPEIRPKRFDTWFLLGALEGDHDVVVCGSEMIAHRWLTPEAALAAHHAGEFQLAPPQFVTLHWLAEFASAADAVRGLSARPLFTFRPRVIRVEGGVTMLYAGDAGYEARDPMLPGPHHRVTVLASGTRYERDFGA